MDVVQRIREDIVSGQLPFDGRLTMRELAARYGVSHMPIREALRELHGEGLVVIERNRGARVRAVNPRFVDNLFRIRSALEIMMTRRAAELCPSWLVPELEQAEAGLEACVARRAFDEALAMNRTFHQAINRAADNPDAAMLIDRHWTLIAAIWGRYGYGPERYAAVTSDHRYLIAAIAARDVEAAGTIMAAHVLKARQELMTRLQAEPKPMALSA